MKLLSKDSIFSLFFALWVYIMLVFRFGYFFGGQDQVELLPFVQWLNDKSLYPNDLFIQSLAQMSFHERSIAASLLLPFSNKLEVVCLILHFMSSVLLIIGLEKWLRSYGVNSFVVKLGILLALVRYPEMVLGEDELYYPLFQTSLLAAAMISWALFFYSEKKYDLSGFLFSISGILHPMETLLPFILVVFLSLYKWKNQQINFRNLFRFVLIYGVGAGLVLGLLAFSKSNYFTSGTDFFQTVFIEWRHPHHYLLESQFNRKLIGFVLFYFVAFLYFFISRNKLFDFVFFGGALLVVYILFSQLGISTSFVLLQGFKLTKWLQLLGGIAVFGVLFKVFSVKQKGRILLIAFSLMLFMYLCVFSNNIFRTTPFEVFDFTKSTEKDISLKAGLLTEKSAVFLTPPDFTSFKFFSKRSSYVDFKANPKREDMINEWYTRIEKGYSISLDNAEKGFALLKPARKNWSLVSEEKFDEYRKLGITHVILYNTNEINSCKLIYKNRDYALYKL